MRELWCERKRLEEKQFVVLLKLIVSASLNSDQPKKASRVEESAHHLVMLMR